MSHEHDYQQRGTCRARGGKRSARRAACLPGNIHREEGERLKAEATARFQAERERQERETRERIEREDADRRAAERALLEEQLRVVFMKTDAATEADWLAVKDELVRAELVRRAQRAFDDSREVQRAEIASVL